MMKHSMPPANPNAGISYDKKRLKEIYLAGGCFWGAQAYLARVPGVAETVTGYANGRTDNPSYEDVCRRGTGHAEAVLVRYDPEMLGLDRLLDAYFRAIDPTVRNRQGNDVGSQYRTGIYYTDPSDRAVAEAALERVRQEYDKPVVTELLPLQNFGRAEEYHQDYLEKNPGGYCHVDFSALAGLEREGKSQ